MTLSVEALRDRIADLEVELKELTEAIADRDCTIEYLEDRLAAFERGS